MSQFFIVNGQKKLFGEIETAGAKNAALPILAACLLTEKPCVISNIPLIADVFRLIEMLQKLGAKTEWLESHTIRIEARDINPKNIDHNLFSEFRASILLIGPLLSRCKNIEIRHPGGCKIGARSIAPHLEAFKNFGIKVEPFGRGYILSALSIRPSKIVMKEFSVTATENVLMTAAAAKETIIKNAAAEPYIQELGRFLEKMGVKIKGLGTHVLNIKGKTNLKGAEWEIMPDPIEMGTFAAMAAGLNSEILIKNFAPEFLETEMEKMKDAGIEFKIIKAARSKKNWYQKTDLLVKKRENNNPLTALSNLHNMPYPGFAADLLPIFACLMTQAKGDTLIHDWMYEGRLRYVDELKKMGAKAVILDPHRVLISGPTPLYGTEITSFDLRAGATLIMAALCAQGQSKIFGAEQIDRGYEKIEERLAKLGADIKRINI